MKPWVNGPVQGLALVGAAGAAIISLAVSLAPLPSAAEEDALRRSDVERIVKALETQAQATAAMAREAEEQTRAQQEIFRQLQRGACKR